MTRISKPADIGGTARVRVVVRVAALAASAALLLFAATALLRFPCVGVADNLDYWRVMRPAGIAHVPPEPAPGAFVRCRFLTGPADLGSGLSSPAVLAWLARHVPLDSTLVGPAGMDLRQMGLVYLSLAALVVVTFFARRPSRPLVVAGWLYVLVDPGFLLFFNSFFADAALFVGLFGTAVWLSSESRDSPSAWGWRTAWLLLLVVIGGAAKMLYILLPAAVVAAVASLHARAVPGRAAKLRLAALMVPLLLLTVGIPWFFFVGPAPRFVRVNNYHAVFAGIVPVSSHPDAVLQALDIPAGDRDLPRTDIWSGAVPLEHPVFERLSTLSRWKLLSLYLTDAGALRSTSLRISRSLGQLSTHPQKTYSQEAGRRYPADQYVVGWQFSRLHALVFGRSPLTPWMVIVLAVAWLTISAARGRWEGHHAAGFLLVLFALSQFVVVILGDGFVALRQHLIGARLALDFLLVLLLHEALAAMPCTPRPRRAS